MAEIAHRNCLLAEVRVVPVASAVLAALVVSAALVVWVASVVLAVLVASVVLAVLAALVVSEASGAPAGLEALVGPEVSAALVVSEAIVHRHSLRAGATSGNTTRSIAGALRIAIERPRTDLEDRRAVIRSRTARRERDNRLDDKAEMWEGTAEGRESAIALRVAELAIAEIAVAVTALVGVARTALEAAICPAAVAATGTLSEGAPEATTDRALGPVEVAAPRAPDLGVGAAVAAAVEAVVVAEEAGAAGADKALVPIDFCWSALCDRLLIIRCFPNSYGSGTA